ACRAGFALDPYPSAGGAPPPPPPCSFSLSPASVTNPVAAGTGSVTVNASASTCNWTAVSNVPWIAVTSGASGMGTGSVGYSVSANTGAPRSGTITIGGQTFTVNQASACSYTVTPPAPAIAQGGGTASV